MKRRQCKLFVYEEIIIDILNRLPLKSLARFKCISENWRKYIAEIYRCRLGWPQPYLIGFFCAESGHNSSKSHFFFSSKESPLLIGTRLDHSFKFIGVRVCVVASSNGFLLCNKLQSRQRVYYVYNPATRQRLDLPKTRISMNEPYVGFSCKVDEAGSVLFTIVRYARPTMSWDLLTIESFSSETNVWTAITLILDVPLLLCPSWWDRTSSSSTSVVDGVFCWLNYGLITVYDSVKMCFWALKLPDQRTVIDSCSRCLGLSGGELCFAYGWKTTIICWRLSNFPSPDNAEWVRKYVVDVAIEIAKCPEDFGVGGNNTNVHNIFFHPALPHILYLQIRGKVISYDLKTSTAELVYDFGEAWWKTKYYKLFSYDWPQWPRLL
ncbi:F-box protein At5g49610-like [Lycium ferocissimum]|uniref:F-box protein At5g49610-like n=1 Tax=Lycium ferocissimum TaxID=112874 RepID=UPI0028160595|nr:F-box protein At5g49610-like [Lycium ferocissimum]